MSSQTPEGGLPPAPPRRRALGLLSASLTALALPAGLLSAGCGTREDADDDAASGTTARLRVVNATGLASVDVYVDDVRRAEGVAAGAASVSFGVEGGGRRIGVAGSSGAVLQPVMRTLAAGSATTLVAWSGEAGAVGYLALDDAEAAPAAGRARLLVFHAARDAGPLDVHLSSDTAALGDATRLLSGLAPGSGSSGHLAVSAGAMRLRLTRPEGVTGDDLRLDVPLALPDRGVVALVIVPGVSGVLAHALRIVAGEPVTTLASARARLRVASAMSDGTALTVRLGGQALTVPATSPTLGAYAQVASGAASLEVRAGTATVTRALDLAAGSDTTVLVGGTAAAPVLTVLADDNRLPATTTTTRLRLLHGLSDQAGTLGVRLGHSGEVRAAAAPGTVSVAGTLTPPSGDTDLLVVDTATAATVLTLAAQRLEPGAVHTVVLLGDSRLAAGRGLVAALVRDR